jgi:hypothetical protein
MGTAMNAMFCGIRTMQIAQAVSRFGTQAVGPLMARLKVVNVNESAIPETEFSLFIARALSGQLGWRAKAERHYTKIAMDECGLAKDTDLVSGFGNCRADVFAAVPGGVGRRAVVEIKIIDEGRKWKPKFREDYDKIRRFQSLLRSKGSTVPIEGYIGGLVCDTDDNTTAEQKISYLQNEYPSLVIESGTRVPAAKGGWGWRFICAKMSAPP